MKSLCILPVTGSDLFAESATTTTKMPTLHCSLVSPTCLSLSLFIETFHNQNMYEINAKQSKPVMIIFTQRIPSCFLQFESQLSRLVCQFYW